MPNKGNKNHIVSVFKTGNRPAEPFKASKLNKAIHAACLNVRTPEDSALATSNIVCKEVQQWLQTKQEVTSLDIKDKTTEILEKYHPEAAYIYNQYGLTI